MDGKFIYFALSSLLGVLCTLNSFLLFFFLALLYFWILFKFKRFSHHQLQWLMAVFLFFLLTSQLTSMQNKTRTSPNQTSFQLEYIDNPTINGNQLQVIAEDLNTNEKFLLRYTISSEKEKKELEARSFFGCFSQVAGSLEIPQQAKNENGFNYREYLKQKHIYWILESKDTPLKNCQPHKMNALIFIKQWRFIGISQLQHNFPPEAAALSAALIYGDKSLMSPELLANYQQIGISHLLAISGLHVSLLMAMIFYLGIRLGIQREVMTNLLLFILPVYAILTGGAPSVFRSVLMLFLVLSTIKWKRKLKLLPIDAISIAFIIFLFVNPMLIFDVGFQLSFAVSAAIIISSPKILLRHRNLFLQMFTVSVAAQLAAYPIILYHFFTVNMISVFANLIFIPLYSYLFLPGVYILLFLQMIMGTVPALLMNLFSKIVQLSISLSEILSTVSFGQITPGRPSNLDLFLYGAIIILIFYLWEQKYSKKNGIYIFVLLLVLFLFQCSENRLNPMGEVDMIDVGQGDSILIHLPFDRGNYLIDTGGVLPFQMEKWEEREKSFEPGKDIVVPFLKSKGITRIDKLILTHGDLDHIGGALSLIKEIKIEQILLPSVKAISESESTVIKAAKEKGIQVLTVSSGQQWKTVDSQFYILSPERNYDGESNRGSLIILARIGGLNWFFGGDLDQEGEEKIVRKYPEAVIDVLKVGHHGSKTSSSSVFLNQFKPRIALISVGEKNRFGHPNKETIDSLKKVGTKVYRTDQQGEISYQFFHEKGTISTYLP